MDVTQIGELVLAAVVGVMGYFLKVIHSDVRQNTKDVGENKGAIKNLNSRCDHESEMHNHKYNSIMEILAEIKTDLKEIRK